MSNLTISNRQVDEIAILDLSGKVTIGQNNRDLHEALKRLVMEGQNRIILNLEKVTSIDSTGLGEIVAGYSTLKTNGGSLKLINLPERVIDLMTITKLYTVFDIYESEAEGIEGFNEAGKLDTQPLEADFAAGAKASSSIF